jgi:hypothetical protein
MNFLFTNGDDRIIRYCGYILPQTLGANFLAPAMSQAASARTASLSFPHLSQRERSIIQVSLAGLYRGWLYPQTSSLSLHLPARDYQHMNCVNTQFKCASQAYTEGALRFVAAKIAQPS